MPARPVCSVALGIKRERAPPGHAFPLSLFPPSPTPNAHVGTKEAPLQAKQS